MTHDTMLGGRPRRGRARIWGAPVFAALISTWLPWGGAAAQPVSDSDFLSIVPPIQDLAVGSTDVRFRETVMIKNSTRLGALSLPFTFPGAATLFVDTTITSPPDIRGVTYGGAGRNSAWTIRTSLVRNDQKSILLGYISFSSFPPMDDTLCYVHMVAASGGGGALVRFDSGTVINQHLVFTSEFAEDCIPTWSRGEIRINYSLAGDMTCDGVVTIGDIVYLVNFLFKSGPRPCAPDLADVDCDGMPALGDIIWLINYLFRGGPAPLSPCGPL